MMAFEEKMNNLKQTVFDLIGQPISLNVASNVLDLVDELNLSEDERINLYIDCLLTIERKRKN